MGRSAAFQPWLLADEEKEVFKHARKLIHSLLLGPDTQGLDKFLYSHGVLMNSNLSAWISIAC